MIRTLAAAFDWFAAHWSVEARVRRAMRDADRAIDRALRLRMRG